MFSGRNHKTEPVLYGDRINSVICSTDYSIGNSLLTFEFLSGFVSSSFVYFVVYDANRNFFECNVSLSCNFLSKDQCLM